MNGYQEPIKHRAPKNGVIGKLEVNYDKFYVLNMKISTCVEGDQELDGPNQENDLGGDPSKGASSPGLLQQLGSLLQS